jgi:hypothetical protein
VRVYKNSTTEPLEGGEGKSLDRSPSKRK